MYARSRLSVARTWQHAYASSEGKLRLFIKTVFFLNTGTGSNSIDGRLISQEFFATTERATAAKVAARQRAESCSAIRALTFRRLSATLNAV